MTAKGQTSRSDSIQQWLAPWRLALNSLQFKASFLVILLVLVVTLAGLGTAMWLTAEAVYGQAGTHALDWATSLASSNAPIVADADKESLVRIVNDTLRTGGVCYVAFSDPRGRLLACGEQSQGLMRYIVRDSGERLALGELASPRLTRDPALGLTYLDVAVPVYGDSPIPGSRNASRKILGYLRLATEVSRAEAQIERMGAQLQWLAILMLLLVAPCTLLAMRKVVGPLNELSKTAKELASGVMDARAKVSAHNEIGDLALAFNDMAARLAGAQFEMLKLNAELEERVQQRTHQLEDLASREPLTGLYNRRYFSDVITREFAAAERYDADLTVLMFDLDHFKETNDKYGHRAGDEVLVLVADCIRAELRESDVAARFGGDEFILLLPRASASAAAKVAERITDRFTEALQGGWPDFPTSLSIGVASLRVTRARTAEVLIHEADLALYAAKLGGRNRTMAATSSRA
jgi:diguanylate cyclase (GGDEF)-like protein